MCGTRIVICVSRFGSPAVVCAENPGAFFGAADARAEGELDAADLAKAVRALSDLEYVVVPEELLESDYEGPSQMPSFVQHARWSYRFFGTFCPRVDGRRHTPLPLELQYVPSPPAG